MGMTVNIAKSLICATIVSLAASVSAQATYNAYWDVEADAGSYGPLALGEDIELDGCGSNIQLVQNRALQFSLCNLTNLSIFSVNWFAKNTGTGAFTWLTSAIASPGSATFGNAATNLNLTTSTGSGSFFSSVGTYAIGIYVSAVNNASYSTPALPSVVTANFGSDWTNSWSNAFSQNGDLNNGAAWSSNFTINEPVVTVPEPESLFLLVPGLALIAARERRRRRKAK